MDITTLAAWGEFVGGIAVVVSLIYLASQIRQNTRSVRVSTAAAVGSSDVEYYKQLLSDPDLGRILNEGMMDRASLSDADRWKFDVLLDMTMRTFQRDYFFAQEGAINPSIWQGERKGYSSMLRSPGGRQWWSEAQALNYYGDEFRGFLEALLREDEPTV